MVLELHIWGPAFGLPSIEPECIATVAYCQRVIPEGQWVLVADYESTVVATGKPTACHEYTHIQSNSAAGSLPILIDDGISTAMGFEDIVAYLRNKPGVADDPDAKLTSRQRTDRTALVVPSNDTTQFD